MFADHYTDDIGRCFCSKHHRSTCHECCLAFDLMNKMAEERAGLRKPPTKAENLANELVMLERGIAYMRANWNPSMRENMNFHKKELARVQGEMKTYRSQGAKEASELATAVSKRQAKAYADDAEKRAVLQEYQRLNPGKKTMEYGGAATQSLYDKVASLPPSATREGAADRRSCPCNYPNITPTL